MSDTAVSTQSRLAGNREMPLPVVRVPMLDQKRELFAYEVMFHRQAGDENELMQRVLSTLADGALTRLVRGNRTFLTLSRELLLGQTDVLAHQPRFGVVLQPAMADDAELMDRLLKMSQRGCLLMLDAGAMDLHGSVALESLLQVVQFVRLDASALSPEQMRERTEKLHERGIWVIAGHVDDHATYQRCLELPLQAIQGRYLLIPDQVEVPVLSANRLSLLRLMRELQENNPGPIELGDIIRNDAILSYKLLSCVNSAYFGLPKQLKSVQQAAIFFGVTRMRNWVFTMALGGMDDRPPELLRTALIRAHMCEQLASHMPRQQKEMAFTVGLFSLLDTLMCAPMAFVLEQLPLVPEIREALVGYSGPFGPLLEQIHAWEAGQLSGQIPPQQIQRMAGIYLEATQWADQVYAFAEPKAPAAAA
ncbi:EAL and HDOD domain-containing protein [Frateuria terrea]|uniref:EAL and modified HD-GYP domain-containing signal transduction protein n=1 Tax=Frateuria terrea TaxID=529704 RepID=A0A1H6W5W6_9GAMM|nr:HDOD domain-containing protein [Frateuria terrea]SEJ07675.1 EAL and modified HD-GYP domain-containing signal transduction protein [Frateuria terrea]SFP69509.1 EAL and modified HD-GYP domain-containing signal transduction protein [Frateuria terrea]